MVIYIIFIIFSFTRKPLSGKRRTYKAAVQQFKVILSYRVDLLTFYKYIAEFPQTSNRSKVCGGNLRKKLKQENPEGLRCAVPNQTT